MRSLLLASAGTIALVAAPAMVPAQVPPAESVAATTTLTAEQQAMVDAWPADRRAAYEAWPSDLRSYFWTLSPNQARGWWALTNEQRGQIFAMTPDQRTAAWVSIEAQLPAETPAPEQVQANPRGEGEASPTPPNPSTAAAPVPPAMPADPGYQAGPYKGALTPPPAEALNKTYPVCTRELQDGCQNPGEGGATKRRRTSKRS